MQPSFDKIPEIELPPVLMTWKICLLKTFKMHQKVVANSNFVHSLSINDNNSKNMHAKITCEVILL